MIKRGRKEKIMVIKEVKNQYGENIPVISLEYDQERKVFFLSELNCYSSQDMGMGTCRCVSHPTWEDRDISRDEALSIIDTADLTVLMNAEQGLNALLTDESLETLIHEKFVLAGFDNQDAVEYALEQAYKLNLNPLPKIREILEGLPIVVAFAYDTSGVGFEAEPRKAVFGVFLDSDSGCIRTEIFNTYHNDTCWMQVMESEDITC
jgi:hypothetical protein